jgi:hypothetical protein
MESCARKPTCDERNAHVAGGALEQGHDDRILSAERPIRLRDRKRRLLESLVQIRRNVHLDPHLFWKPRGLWIRARDQYATVREECRLRVIKPCDDRGVEDREALTDGLRWVVEERIVVGIGCQSKSGEALVGPIQDHVRPVAILLASHTTRLRVSASLPIRKGGHARHYSLRWLYEVVKFKGARNKLRIHAPFSLVSTSGSRLRVRWICSCRVLYQPRASTHRKSESQSVRYTVHIAEEAWPILPSDTSGPRGSCSLHRAYWAAL